MFAETIPSEGLEGLQLSTFRYNECKSITTDFMNFYELNVSLMIGFPRFIIRLSPDYFFPLNFFIDNLKNLVDKANG